MARLGPTGLTQLLNDIKTWVLSKIPTKTSQLTNDSNYLTSHQSLSNYSTLANTVKSISISGKTITVTPGSGSAYTLTTQDTNTDTLVTQNVSTTNSTYPILLCPTANATSNQGAKTGIFAKSVKINPSTNVISASGFSGPLTGNVTGNVTGNCSGSSGSCTGNAATATKLATARSITLGNEFIGSANFDGSGNITINGSAYLSVIGIGNKNNYPYHCFAKFGPITSQYTDAAIKLLVSRQYISGGTGIIELEFRTNATNGDGQCDVRWIVRSSKIPVDCIQVGFYKTWGGIYADVFYKSSGAYDSCVIRSMGDGSRASYERKFTLQDSSEANNTTTSDPLTSVNSYASIAAAGTALHNQAYTDTITATDSGVVGSANACTGNAATATKATGNANGKELTNTIIKGLSISGKTITYTQIDGNTGTLTTQDNNTDTLMTQNVSTTNATYPILLCATADATVNQGAKTGIFGSGVKVNPSTSAIVANALSGVPSASLYVSAVKDGGALINAQTTTFGTIWRAPTKNYQIGAATWPSNGDNVYICYSVSNTDVAANNNYVTKYLMWNADSGTLTADSFSGALTGNVTGNVTGNCSGSSGSCTGNAATATQFSANKSVTLTGDVTGTASSKAGWSVATTLANSGVTAGSYGPTADVTGNNNATISVPQITVDAKGRVTAVVNRTLTCKNNTYTVNNATLTIQKNGTNVATFTSNASSNATANITVPTKVSELTNDSGYLTSHQSLSNYVTLNSAQTISATKTISADLKFSTTATRGTAPSSTINKRVANYVDSAGNNIALIGMYYNTNKSSETKIFAYKTTEATGNNIGCIGIGCDASGLVYTEAPTPSTSDNSTKIATTAFVKAQGYITSSSNITGTSANVTGTVAIAHGGTGATTRLGAVQALTNENVGTGTEYFLTITTSWGKAGYCSVADAKTVLDCVTLSGAQTITGNKTFSGTVTATTPAATDSSTKVATTAWVKTAEVQLAARILVSKGTRTTTGTWSITGCTKNVPVYVVGTVSANLIPGGDIAIYFSSGVYGESTFTLNHSGTNSATQYTNKKVQILSVASATTVKISIGVKNGDIGQITAISLTAYQ